MNTTMHSKVMFKSFYDDTSKRLCFKLKKMTQNILFLHSDISPAIPYV